MRKFKQFVLSRLPVVITVAAATALVLAAVADFYWGP